ncbi:hypothetical protein Tco_0695296 [Tanacetum coccineum]
MFFPTSSNFLHTIIPTTILENQVHIEWHDMVQDGDPLLQACDENEHPHTATCQCCKKGIKVQNDLKEFHEEMREIQPLANAATQRRKK